MAFKEHSHPWEPSTVPVSSRARALVLEAVEDQFQAKLKLKAAEGVAARRSHGAKREKEIITVGALVLDVLAHHQIRTPNPLIITLNQTWLSAGPGELLARNRTVTERLKYLDAAGWVLKRSIALNGRSVTALVPGQELVSAAKRLSVSLEDIGVSEAPPEIELKGEKPKDEDFPSRPLLKFKTTKETARTHNQLVRLSDYIAKASLEGVETDGVVVDTRKRRIVRSFLDGSFQRGGRLGGPAFWLNLPRKLRRTDLRIDGEPIAEVDVRAMMPSIAYALNGAVPEGDPYTLEVDPEIPRGAVKISMMQLLWCHVSNRTPLAPEARMATPSEHKAKEVFQFIKDRNAPIAELLGRPDPIGAELMWHEGEIIIEATLRCFEEGFTALPLHDAFLTSCSAAGRAEEILGEAFKDRLGVSPTVKVDYFDGLAREIAA